MRFRDPSGRQEILVLPIFIQIIQHITPLGEAREPSVYPRACMLFGVLGGNIFLHTQGLHFTLPRLPSLLQMRKDNNKNNEIAICNWPISLRFCLPLASLTGFYPPHAVERTENAEKVD